MSNEEITYEQVMEYCRKRNLDLIDHAFLIRLYNNRKAIPVEWIEEWGWKNGMSESMSLRVMIDDWEKENEQ